MIFLFETNLNKNNRLFFELLKILGLGKQLSKFICKKLGFSKNLKIEILSTFQILKLMQLLNKFKLIGNKLKKFQFSNLKKKLNIKLISAIKQINGLPIRGQRTHTNAKTSKKNFLIKMNI